MKRATAGTNGIAVHIPPGFPFAPKLPDKDDELFMGSATVVADGDPFSHIAHPVLACQVAGMMSPIRPKKKGGPMAMRPADGVQSGHSEHRVPRWSADDLVDGDGVQGGVQDARKVREVRAVQAHSAEGVRLPATRVSEVQGAAGRAGEHPDWRGVGRSSRTSRCPVASRSSGCAAMARTIRATGACGYGWETLADTRLEVDPADGTVSMRHPTVGPLFFAATSPWSWRRAPVSSS